MNKNGTHLGIEWNDDDGAERTALVSVYVGPHKFSAKLTREQAIEAACDLLRAAGEKVEG